MHIFFAFLCGAGIVAGAVFLWLRPGASPWSPDFVARARELLKRAPPRDASPGLATGWALASGLGFGILLPNVTSLFGADELTIKLSAIAVILFPVAVLALYFWHLNKSVCLLSSKWNALVWVHYRPLFATLASRSNARLDFVTHRGSDFHPLLESEASKEFAFGLLDQEAQKRPGSFPDLLIADFDIIESIEETLQSGIDPGSLLPLSQWGLPSDASKLGICTPIQPLGANAKHLPLRWGFNALTILDVTQEFSEETAIPSLSTAVDLRAFLRDPETFLSKYVRDVSRLPLILVLDWYLPNLAALVQSDNGLASWRDADQRHLQDARGALDDLALLMKRAALDNSVDIRHLFCADVVEMQSRARNVGRAVIPIGGNFMWRTRCEPFTQHHVIHLPYIIEGTPSCMWWQEALLVTHAQRNGGTNSQLRADLRTIVASLSRDLTDFNDRLPFHAYLGSEESGYTDGVPSVVDTWRQFAIQNGHSRSTTQQADAAWVQLWRDWRKDLLG